ncbi:hypothetical protein CYG48_15235 [Neorhizobium sp. SOG26]|uniref:DUF2628 domain-containing protein n=1 Tax=Neorhizobium sp. SOG26 TaxID=2060726 RepID=UPI000E57B704|nr:DUF2628 domain-containing protein [Neorhizobium sp. SOG26]AXV16925.1 hypothetical protein CYG48_15235 [Neorhizobium sp. SOG26]
MRSYLVLTPPGGPDRDHRSTLIMRDGFSWPALFFPWAWLLWNRLWIAAIVVFLLQGLSGFLMGFAGLELAGGLFGFALSLLVALEGRHYRSESLIRRGWTLEAVIPAPDLDTAEETFFAGLPEPQTQPMPASADWARDAKSPAGWQAPPMGLFEHGAR